MGNGNSNENRRQVLSAVGLILLMAAGLCSSFASFVTFNWADKLQDPGPGLIGSAIFALAAVASFGMLSLILRPQKES